MHGGALPRPETVAMLGTMRQQRRRVRNRVPALLAARGLGWGDLSRRTLLPPNVVRALRHPHANPRIGVAARIAAALDVPIEQLWLLDDES